MLLAFIEDPDSGLADRGGNGSQIVEQPDFFGDAFDQRPELAAIAEEILRSVPAVSTGVSAGFVLSIL